MSDKKVQVGRFTDTPGTKVWHTIEHGRAACNSRWKFEDPSTYESFSFGEQPVGPQCRREACIQGRHQR